MTLQELYRNMDGDYNQALCVLHVEKLIDKHIRKFQNNGVVDAVLAAGKDMDDNALFETTHALKGVSANLGLVGLSEIASELTEEFRPGHARTLSDAEVAARLEELETRYRKTVEAIKQYVQA